MRSLLVVAAFLAVAGWVVVHHLPERDAEAGENPRAAKVDEIQSISIDGGQGRLPITALRAQLTTKVGEALDTAKLAHDRDALETLMTSRGYLSAKVAPAAITHGPLGGAYVVFDVDPGPIFHFRSVEVTGPGKQEVGVVTIASGDDAIGERAAHAVQALHDTLARRGRTSTVELAQHTDVSAAAVDVTITTR
jgi:surface antigen-like variable number repeat protein